MTVLGENTQRYQITIPETGNQKITLSWGIATDVGYKRSHNEDSLVALGAIFAVADGMGGHSSGDLASDAVVTRLAEAGKDGPFEPEGIVAALHDAMVDISHVRDDRELGSGTTATGIALTSADGAPHWIVFNVGDSRVYLHEDHELTQVTVDHSVVQDLVSAGLISPLDAEHHPDSNVVTRAVGFNSEPEPDIWLLPVKQGTRLLLCSDGLTREVNNSRLQEILSSGNDAHETALDLINSALAEGGRDNVTAIVVDVLKVKTSRAK